jgi:hypothetical protein
MVDPDAVLEFLKFCGEVLFPDGSTVSDPPTDALGYVYPDDSSRIAGTDRHELGPDGKKAWPA